MADPPCESPVADRTSEGFLSPVKTGSRDPADLLTPGSKPGATVLTSATPTVERGKCFRARGSKEPRKAFFRPLKRGYEIRRTRQPPAQSRGLRFLRRLRRRSNASIFRDS